MLTATTKTRARSLQRAAQAMFGTKVRLSQAYELIAQMEGYPNWDTAKARLEFTVGLTPTSVPGYISVQDAWVPHDGLVEKLFASNPRLAANPQLLALLENMPLKTPSLILITGKPGSGRSTLSRALMYHYSEKLKARVMNARVVDQQSDFSAVMGAALRAVPDYIFVSDLSTEARLLNACDAVRTGTTTIATACWERYHPSLLTLPIELHTPEVLRALDTVPTIRIHIEV